MSLPIQYLEEKAYFMDFEFKVTRDTFIPRPETEILVEKIVRDYKDMKSTQKTMKILDIGTGSGNIAISLTKYLEHCTIYGLDISYNSIIIAKFNAIKNNVMKRCFLFQSDLFSGIRESVKFDIIVSNPPYITGIDMSGLPDEVKHEPILALYGGKDGLEFYKKIISNAYKFLNKNGHIYFEIGYDQGQSVLEILKNVGYTDIEVLKDYSGFDRIVKAKWIH